MRTTNRRSEWMGGVVTLAGLTAAMLLLLTGAGDAQSPGRKLAGAEVRIGALVPVTGTYTNFGKSVAVTAQAIVDEWNAQGGIGGAKVSLIHYDSAKPDEAARLVRRLAVDDKVLAILGPLSTAEAQVVFPVCNKQGVVAVAFASSSPGIAAQNRPWAFRNTVDEGTIMEGVVGAVVKRTGAKKAVLIYDEKDATGTNVGTKVMPAVAKRHNLEIVNAQEPLTLQSGDLDVSAQVTRIKQLNPDVILFSGPAGPAGLAFLRELKKQELRMPVLGSTQLINDKFLEPYPELSVVAGATYFVGMGRGAVEFERKIGDALKKAGTPVTRPSQFDANTWEILDWFKQAIEKGGVTNHPNDLAKDRERIRDYIQALRGYKGLAGNIDMTPTGDVKKDFNVVLGRGGKWQHYDQ